MRLQVLQPKQQYLITSFFNCSGFFTKPKIDDNNETKIVAAKTIMVTHTKGEITEFCKTQCVWTFYKGFISSMKEF